MLDQLTRVSPARTAARTTLLHCAVLSLMLIRGRRFCARPAGATFASGKITSAGNAHQISLAPSVEGSIMSPFVLVTHLCKALPLHQDQLRQHQSSLLQYTVVLGQRQTTCMPGYTLQFCSRRHNWNCPILKLPHCLMQWPGRYWMVAARGHISPLEFSVGSLYLLWEWSPYKSRLLDPQRATTPHVMLFSLVLPPRMTESFR